MGLTLSGPSGERSVARLTVPFRRQASKLGRSNAKAADPKLNSTGLWLSSPTQGNSGLCCIGQGGGSAGGAAGVVRGRIGGGGGQLQPRRAQEKKRSTVVIIGFAHKQGMKRGGGAYSFFACLGRSTIDRASQPRRSILTERYDLQHLGAH